MYCFDCSISFPKIVPVFVHNKFLKNLYSFSTGEYYKHSNREVFKNTDANLNFKWKKWSFTTKNGLSLFVTGIIPESRESKVYQNSSPNLGHRVKFIFSMKFFRSEYSSFWKSYSGFGTMPLCLSNLCKRCDSYRLLSVKVLSVGIHYFMLQFLFSAEILAKMWEEFQFLHILFNSVTITTLLSARIP